MCKLLLSVSRNFRAQLVRQSVRLKRSIIPKSNKRFSLKLLSCTKIVSFSLNPLLLISDGRITPVEVRVDATSGPNGARKGHYRTKETALELHPKMWSGDGRVAIYSTDVALLLNLPETNIKESGRSLGYFVSNIECIWDIKFIEFRQNVNIQMTLNSKTAEMRI